MRSTPGFLIASLLASLFCATVFVPASAHAAGNENEKNQKESPPKAEDPTAGLKGFELMVRPSFGGAPSTSPVRYQPDPGAPPVSGSPGALLQGATPWSPGFVGQASIGYRFSQYVSAGL